MVLLAYVGLMFGLGMEAVRLSRNARNFHEASLSEQSIGDGFEIQAQKYLADVGLRKKNADELRHGRIPEDLQDEHKTFLRSLDKTAGEDDRRHRFSQIADLEQQRAQQSEEMSVATIWPRSIRRCLLRSTGGPRASLGPRWPPTHHSVHDECAKVRRIDCPDR